MLKLTLLTTPFSSHPETDFFDYTPTMTAILKFTFLPTPFSRNAETDFINHAPFQTC
jgi:hypothetical protein